MVKSWCKALGIRCEKNEDMLSYLPSLRNREVRATGEQGEKIGEIGREGEQE